MACVGAGGSFAAEDLRLRGDDVIPAASRSGFSSSSLLPHRQPCFVLAFLSFIYTAYLALEIQLQNEPAIFPASAAIAPAGPQSFLPARWSGSKNPQFLVSRPGFCICFRVCLPWTILPCNVALIMWLVLMASSYDPPSPSPAQQTR